MRIGPANTANTPNDAIPVPVRGSGWSVSEPPISAVSHRLVLLIFSRRQFFSVFLHSRCQNGFDDSSGLMAWCLAVEPLQAASHGYMQAMFRSCFICKGKLLFSNQTLLCPILLQWWKTDSHRPVPSYKCGSRSLSNCCLKELPIHTFIAYIFHVYLHVYVVHLSWHVSRFIQSRHISSVRWLYR